jgi:hypothetical protein
MRNRLVGFALLTAVVMTLTVGPVDAQKTKDKKTAEVAATGKVEFYENEKGKYRYKIVDAEGSTIAMPIPKLHWDTKEDCLKAIAELKSILNTSKPVEVEVKSETKTEKSDKK